MTPQSLGERIAQARREKAARDRRDISQRDIAAAVGVSAPTVSDWESDKISPREDKLAKLAAYFGVTPAFLRYGVEPHATSVTMRPEIVAGRGSPSEPITEPAKDRKKKA